MARRYDIEGTRTPLYWAIGLALLCVWCVRDGWFPTEKKKLEKIEYLAFQTTKGEWVSADKASPDVGKAWKDATGTPLVPVVLAPEKVDRNALTLPEKPAIAVREKPDRFYFLFNQTFAILSALGTLVAVAVYMATK